MKRIKAIRILFPFPLKEERIKRFGVYYSVQVLQYHQPTRFEKKKIGNQLTENAWAYMLRVSFT